MDKKVVAKIDPVAEIEQRAMKAAQALGGGWRFLEIPGVGPVGFEIVLVETEAARLMPCPDGEICQRCLGAEDDDACFPSERARVEMAEAARDAVKAELQKVSMTHEKAAEAAYLAVMSYMR